nr:uncharacterized protein LOC109756611 [Aegilops tauschii subsp. strangulata]
MPDFNAHGLDPNWAEPGADQVQEFFDILSEKYVRDEPSLVRDTTKEELDYIAARAAEAELAREAGSTGHVEDEAEAAAEEKELAGWAGPAGDASSADTGAPLVEDVVDKSTEEEAEADDPLALEKKCVLQRASSGEPVRPGRTEQRQEIQGESVRLTRAAAAKKVVKAAVVKKKASASSSSKRPWTPPASPPPADVDIEVVFDFGSLSPRRKRKLVEEEAKEEDTETLAQRAAKRAKASTGDKPPAGTSSTPLVEYIDTVIEDVARDAEAEASKIAAEEAANTTAEDAAKGPDKEAGKAKSRMAAVDKAEADLKGRVAETQAWFRQAHEELKVAQDLLAERKLELVMKQAELKSLKLEGLEGMLSEVRSREETLAKNLEKERQLRKNDAANYEDFVKGENLWISHLADVAGRITM